MRLAPIRRIAKPVAAVLGIVVSAAAYAAPSWTTGHISNITYTGGTVFIMTDSPLPDNCAGTPSGWMVVPATDKAMIAFVTGLWMRGDAAQVTVSVYTTGLVNGWCEINQIDPTG